jgi:hypothetical protein
MRLCLHDVLVENLESEYEAENGEDPPVGFALRCKKKKGRISRRQFVARHGARDPAGPAHGVPREVYADRQVETLGQGCPVEKRLHRTKTYANPLVIFRRHRHGHGTVFVLWAVHLL